MRGTVVLGVISVLSAALVAANPATAGDNGNHYGNAAAYGQTKKDTPPPPPPSDPGSPTDTSSGSTQIGNGGTPSAPLVNSIRATLAFYDTSGARAVVGTSPVKAVITITNTSTTTAPFGSARINTMGFTACPTSTPPCSAITTDPAGFTVMYFGSLLSIRGNTSNNVVAPNASITITSWVVPQVACNATTGLAWPVAAWISTNLNGTAFPSTTTTPIGFLKFTGGQPPVATAYNANMSPAQVVTSYDACGAAAAPTSTVSLTDALGWLTGGGSGSASGATTTFSSLQFTNFDETDTLTANALGYTSSDPSRSFLVAEKVQPCNANSCPPLTLDSQPKTSAVIIPTANPGADVLVSGSATGPDNTLCNAAGSGISDSEISSTIAVDTPVSKTLTITLAKSLVNAISNNGAPFMSVCLRVPGEPDLVLPDCSKGNVQSPPPCVLNRGKNKANEVITVQLPAGDPHLGVY